jgi:hypothetical protein
MEVLDNFPLEECCAYYFYLGNALLLISRPRYLPASTFPALETMLRLAFSEVLMFTDGFVYSILVCGCKN